MAGFSVATRAAVLAALAFLLLCALSVNAWSEAHRLRQMADRSHDLEKAAQALSAIAGAAETPAAQKLLEQLVRDPQLGFRFLALRDTQGRARASAGRYEQWPLPWLPADWVLQLRELLYAMTSSHGTLTLGNGAATLEYAHGAPDQRVWQDQALSRLSRYSTLGFLCGLCGLLALAYFLQKRAGRAAPQPWSAQRRVPQIPETSEPTLDLLEQVGVGVILLDRRLRVRRMNPVAERLSGWTARDALDQQVFSVARLRGLADQPLEAELHAAWQVSALAPVTLEAWIQNRASERRCVEVIAAQTRDRGGVTGAVLLLKDAGARHAELEKLREAARLPHSLMDRLEEGILQTDSAGVIRYANERLRVWLGYTPEALKGESISKLLPVPFMNQQDLHLKDYAVRSAPLPAVMAWHQEGYAVPVELWVEYLPGDSGLAVVLRPKA